MHYRASPLTLRSRRVWGLHRMRAGNRAPDIALRRPDGGAITLFELLNAGRWVAWGMARARSERSLQRIRDMLALCSGVGIHSDRIAPALEAAQDALLDLYGDAARIYGLRGECFMLIRPDGYVAVLQRPLRPARLHAYLARLWPSTMAQRQQHADVIETGSLEPAREPSRRSAAAPR